MSDPTLRHARLACSAAFFLDGLTFASWVTRIPVIQEKLALRNSVLGFALLMVSVGALVSMPITGKLTVRFGSRAASALAVAFFGAGLLLPSMAVGVLSLSVALLIFGAGFGTANVAINAQAVSVERRYGRPIMSTFHAIFSFGGISGAALGSVLTRWHVSPMQHFSGVALVVVLCSGLMFQWLLHDREPAVSTVKLNFSYWPFVGLGMIAFCSAMGEGSMSDWSAVFLKQVSHTDASVAALGFAAFSISMTAGRLTADRITHAVGPVNMIRIGSTIAASGLGLAMLLPNAATATTGFALVGLGLAALMPTTFSAAGRMPGVPPSVAIAAVSTMGYFGFLSGPPLIGIASEWVTLRWAMALVFAACCTATWFGRYADVRGSEGLNSDEKLVAVVAGAGDAIL